MIHFAPALKAAIAGAALALIGVSAAEAALPPYYQRALELETIVKNAEVAKALSGKGPIDSVTRVSEDQYVVEAGTCTLDVKVVTDTSGEQAPGPRRIKLEVAAPQCK